MNKALWALALAVFFVPSQASAAVPFPGNCTITLSPSSAACQYRFLADGSGDVLVATVTVLDALLTPCFPCAVTLTLVPAPGTAFCSCCPNPQIVNTNAAGVATFTSRRIGGCGQLALNFVACTVALNSPPPILFSTPDIDASCDVVGPSTTVIDLAKWSVGISSYTLCSDFNCDGTVGVADLGFWASGFTKNCAMGVCP